MEYAEEGDLLAQHKLKKLAPREGRLVIQQILLGLQYLHARQIIHRDIKPSNILFTSRTPIHIKLADFGHSASSADKLRTMCGTERYAAPEMFHPPYTQKVDIWSLGIIALDLWTSAPEFERSKWDETVKHRISGLSPGLLQDFLKRTLCIDPDDRGTADQCLRLSFLYADDFVSETVVGDNDDELVDTAIWDPISHAQQDVRCGGQDIQSTPPTMAAQNPGGLHVDGEERQNMSCDIDIWDLGLQNLPDALSPDSELGVAAFLSEVSPVRCTNDWGKFTQNTKLPSERELKDCLDRAQLDGIWIYYSQQHHVINFAQVLSAFRLETVKIAATLRRSKTYEFVALRGRRSGGTYLSCQDAMAAARSLNMETTRLERFIETYVDS